MWRRIQTTTIIWMILLFIVGQLVVLDQMLKEIMVRWIGPDQPAHRHEVLGRAFAFEYVENRGAAFGLFPRSTAVLAVISVIAAAIGIYVMWNAVRSSRWTAFAIALIVGGALGNGIDRLFRGYVVDYIAVGNFWKFNLADSAVTIGVLLVFVTMVFHSDHQHALQEQTG